MRIFGSDRISGLMQRLGMEEGVPIEHKMVTNAIARAQKQVEAQNFSVRKHLLEYDDVMNKQRESVYALRRELLEGKIHLTEDEAVDSREYSITLAEELLDSTVERYAGDEVESEDRDYGALKVAVSEIFGIEGEEIDAIDLEELGTDAISDALWKPVLQKYETKEALVPTEILRRVERDIMLQIVDAQWKDHLYSLDHLKEGIGLRGYGQRDPLVEYKKESFTLFQAMKDRIEEENRPLLVAADAGQRRGRWRTARPAATATPSAADHHERAAGAAAVAVWRHRQRQLPLRRPESPRPARTGGDDVIKQVRRDEPKVGRNDPCPCGSGKKYKKCHGS